jgi:glutamyl-tRNA reductase
MSEIKHFECDTRKQGYEEEDKYMVEMKATMNSNKSSFDAERPHEPKLKKEKKDIKEWRRQNADKLNEANKKYYQEHKEERKAYRESIAEEQKKYKKAWYQEHKEECIQKNQEEYTCVCGKVGKLTNKARHEKSKFHVEFLKQPTTTVALNTTSWIQPVHVEYVNEKVDGVYQQLSCLPTSCTLDSHPFHSIQY